MPIFRNRFFWHTFVLDHKLLSSKYFSNETQNFDKRRQLPRRIAYTIDFGPILLGRGQWYHHHHPSLSCLCVTYIFLFFPLPEEGTEDERVPSWKFRGTWPLPSRGVGDPSNEIKLSLKARSAKVNLECTIVVLSPFMAVCQKFSTQLRHHHYL